MISRRLVSVVAAAAALLAATSRAENAGSAAAATQDALTKALAAEVRDKGWIVLSARSDQGDWDLHLVRPDGSDRRKITDTPEYNEAGARFSPDGRRLLYFRMPKTEAVDNNTYGTYDLVIADAAGSRAEVYGRGFPWASWGPDGKQLACLAKAGIQIVDLESRKIVRQLPRRGIAEQLSWSPDGKWFVGTANGLGPYWNIGTLNVETGQLAAVSETDRYNCTPDWLPDSRRVVYSRGIVPTAGGWAELWVASGDGKENRLVYAEDQRHIYGGCVSPDGKYVLFTRSEADLGKVDNSQTRIALARWADTPIVAGRDESLRKRRPDARRGPILDLSWGWEPHWTGTDVPGGGGLSRFLFDENGTVPLRSATVVSSPVLSDPARAQVPSASVRVSFQDRLGPLEMDRMALGQGGLSEEPMWSDRIAEIAALRPRLIRIFLQEYFNLLPERGRYHFATLDRSLETILKTGAKPLMCICFKPRVLFPAVDQDRVEPADYEQWEQLVFNLVKHYRESGAGIRYWEVANEPDIGEDGGCPYRFKPESYLRYYQRTVAAILRADPQARVGGPALASVRSPILPALLAGCEQRKTPLDFVSWHVYSSDPAGIRGTIDYAKDLLKKHPALKPQTILDEWNMDLMNPHRDPRFQPCYVAEVIWQMIEAGLDYSCYYHIRDYHVDHERFAPFMSPQGAAFMARWWNRTPQYDGLFDYQNQVRPAYFTFKLLSRLSGRRLRMTSSHATVHGFAVHDERLRMYALLLWNFSSAPVEIALSLESLPADLRMRHLVLDATAPSNDENARLRPEPAASLPKGSHRLRASFEPYAVHYWSFE